MHQSRPRRAKSASIAMLVAGFGFVGLARPQADFEDWMTMRAEVLNAQQLIGSDVSNGVTSMGMVSDLVLSPDGKKVQYLLFEVPYPTSLWDGDDGFVAFEDVVFEPGLGLDVQVSFDPEESVRLPDQLELSVDELDRRLASRVLDRQIDFEGAAAVEIKNMFVDRETGDVTHYVVETDPAAIFRSERRTVPADRVVIGEDGGLAVELDLEALEGLQEFDQRVL